MSPGIHAICDPTRTQYLTELLDGSNVHRAHIQELLELEPPGGSNAASHLDVLTDAILARFPADGLRTTSATALTDLFLSDLETGMKLPL
jgi:hypothetical protein